MLRYSALRAGHEDIMVFNFALMIFFLCFLPAIVSLFGRDSRWKGLSLGLCVATMLSVTGSDLLSSAFWLGAWGAAIVAIVTRFRPKADSA